MKSITLHLQSHDILKRLAFKPLLSLEDDVFNKVAENISKLSRRWEWTAIFLGISVFMGEILQPWNLDWASGYFWLTVYFVITATIVYGLMGWIIYDTLVGIVRVSRLSHQDPKLDILNTEMMTILHHFRDTTNKNV